MNDEEIEKTDLHRVTPLKGSEKRTASSAGTKRAAVVECL